MSQLTLFFFFNDTATTEIYTLSLHDALPISWATRCSSASELWRVLLPADRSRSTWPRKSATDRKSTRLNSSHLVISYAVFCLKKKNQHVPRSHTHLSVERVAAGSATTAPPNP